MAKLPDNLKDLRVYLDSDLHLRLKIICAKRNRSMSSVAAELISQWVEEEEKLDLDPAAGYRPKRYNN